MNVVDDADGPLDPRIQIELENLNNATDDINKLEIELDEAHTAFRQLLSESTKRLKEIANKIGGSCIDKARCYYEALEIAQQARVQCQQQAQLFQRASEIHAAAKETVALAEARFMANQHEWNFDQAWQDMLNHATIKVMDAENQKAACAREHHRRAMLFHDAEKKVQELEEKNRRSIIKARPYFEMRSQCEQMMATQKERVEHLQKKVKERKGAYACSLRTLEDISNQIHERRRDYDIVANGPREPGVGAELITPDDSLNYEAELNKVTISRIHSVASSEPDMDDREQDFDDVFELKQRVDNLCGRSADGMESTSSQWELELQASMKKIKEIHLGESSSADVNKELTSSGTKNESEKSAKDYQSASVKQCVDLQPGKFSLTNYQGWHSLTQSPINSIISKSKDALRNSISKSLSNSPVNMRQFSFVRSKLDRTQNIEKSTAAKEKKESRNSSKSQDCDSLSFDTVKTLSDTSHDNQKSSQNEKVNSEDLSHNLSVDSRTENPTRHSDVAKVQKDNFTSHSLSSSPVKRHSLYGSKSSKSFDVEKEIDQNREFKKPNCPSKELPLLSFFRNSAGMSKNKSCSMVDLGDKQNLKTLFENSSSRNLQTASVERLANARHKLVCNNNGDLNRELQKKMTRLILCNNCDT